MQRRFQKKVYYERWTGTFHNHRGQIHHRHTQILNTYTNNNFKIHETKTDRTEKRNRQIHNSSWRFFFLEGRIFFFFNLFLAVLGLCFVQGLSLVAASRGHSSSRCAGLSLSWPLLLWGTGSRRSGSVVVAHGLSCSVACGIFPDQGLNPCPLHWQGDSQPLCHQESPVVGDFNTLLSVIDRTSSQKNHNVRED